MHRARLISYVREDADKVEMCRRASRAGIPDGSTRIACSPARIGGQTIQGNKDGSIAFIAAFRARARAAEVNTSIEETNVGALEQLRQRRQGSVVYSSSGSRL